MAVNNFVPPAGDDFISLAAFPGFAPFTHPLHTASPPETCEDSPDSGAEKGPEGLQDDEQEEDEDGDSLGDRLGASKRRASLSGNVSKRAKASSAERRATHNAIERARRESLNGRFLELASALPTMANVKRPSKSVIVNKSLEWIYDSQVREHALVRENNALRAELNDMRARLQMPPLPPPAPLPLASDYSRLKSNVPPPLTTPAVPHPLMNAHSTALPEGYFAGSLGALHHPATLTPFGAPGVSAPPPSAPANMMAFTNPFNQAAFGSNATDNAQQPASPTAKSEGRGDAGAVARSGSAEAKSDVGVQTKLPSASPPAFGPSSLDSIATSEAAAVAATQASTYAALHAMHQQHLQALAASQHVQGQQAQSGCGTASLTAAPWLSAGFGPGAQYMF